MVLAYCSWIVAWSLIFWLPVTMYAMQKNVSELIKMASKENMAAMSAMKAMAAMETPAAITKITLTKNDFPGQ